MHSCSKSRLNLLDNPLDKLSLATFFALINFGGGASDKGFFCVQQSEEAMRSVDCNGLVTVTAHEFEECTYYCCRVISYHFRSGHLIIFIGVVIVVPAILPLFVLPVAAGLFPTGVNLLQPIHHSRNEAP